METAGETRMNCTAEEWGAPYTGSPPAHSYDQNQESVSFHLANTAHYQDTSTERKHKSGFKSQLQHL